MKTIQPRYTKAAILKSLNQPLIVDQVELPERLDTGQVLVKLHVSGICGSQIGEIKGVKGEDPYLPHLMGHEGCATVLDVGPGVQFVSKDDLVVLHWREGKGIRARPPVYKWNNEILNAGWVTTFNSYAVVSENKDTRNIKNESATDVTASSNVGEKVKSESEEEDLDSEESEEESEEEDPEEEAQEPSLKKLKTS